MIAKFKSLFSAPKNRSEAADAQPSGEMVARDCYREMQALIKTPRPVIIDGGARLGETSLKFLSIFPEARIFAFEANPEIMDELRKQVSPHPQIKVLPHAIGAENKNIQFNITNFNGGSSVLQPNRDALKHHGEKIQVKTTREVSMVRIDSVITEPDIDIIKLDLQGFELDALKGADKILKNTKLIFTEIEFTELYHNAALFSHIDLFLRSHGFRLLNFYNMWTLPSGQLTSGDAIYLNTKHF